MVKASNHETSKTMGLSNMGCISEAAKDIVASDLHWTAVLADHPVFNTSSPSVYFGCGVTVVYVRHFGKDTLTKVEDHGDGHRLLEFKESHQTVIWCDCANYENGYCSIIEKNPSKSCPSPDVFKTTPRDLRDNKRTIHSSLTLASAPGQQ